MEDIEITVLKNLKESFKDLKDIRQKSKTHYKIWDIVCYVIFAQMSGAEDWEDIEEFIEVHYDFFRSFLLMTGGIPNWQTIEIDIIDIDGRVDCGSSRKSTNYNERVLPLNILNAYSNNHGICLASEIIEEKQMKFLLFQLF